MAHAEKAIGIDQLQYRDLLLLHGRHGVGGNVRVAVAALLGKPDEGFDDRRVRDVARTARLLLHLVEVTPPFLRHGLGILEVGLVQILDEGRIAAEQVRAAEGFFHHDDLPLSQDGD
jgi:hypothetical protein